MLETLRRLTILGRLSLLVLLTVALGACAGASAADRSTPVVGTPISITSSGTQVVTVQAFDAMRFEPNAIIVHAGQPVELTLKNQGQTTHDFTLADGVAHPVKILAQPGQAATSTFTIERPGTYTFICAQPFHQTRGMQGTITAR